MAQFMLGRPAPWMPRFIRERAIAREFFSPNGGESARCCDGRSGSCGRGCLRFSLLPQSG
jgi:hypothetical protein